MAAAGTCWTTAPEGCWRSELRSPGSSSLATATVTLSINQSALNLPAGGYRPAVAFTNVSIGQAARRFQIKVLVIIAPILSESWMHPQFCHGVGSHQARNGFVKP
jgi:hypothetical protein